MFIDEKPGPARSRYIGIQAMASTGTSGATLHRMPEPHQGGLWDFLLTEIFTFQFTRCLSHLN